MVVLKEVKKKLKDLRTLKEQKEYLEGLLKEDIKDEFLIKAIHKLLGEISKLIEQEKKDLPHKTIDDLFAGEVEGEIERPDVPAREVIESAGKYYAEVPQGLDTAIKGVAEPEAKKVVKYETPSISLEYGVGTRGERIDAIRSYLKDIKKATNTFSETVFDTWKGTSQMDDLYGIVEKTFHTSDPFEVRRTVREVMNVQDQYTAKKKEDFEKKYLKGLT
jgi:hypothetical protein